AGVARLVQVPVAATATTALVTATYVFSAYALLVYGRALLLFVVSVPAAALGLALGLAPEGSVSPWVGPTVLAYAVLVPFALTVWTTRQPNLPHLPPASEALRAGGHALYGWCCAVFLAWATMTSAHVTTLSGLAGSIVLVPLVLSMGVMEAIVERLLGRLRALASLPLTFEGLIGRARTAILVGLAAYAASLVLLHVVMAVVTSTAVPLAHLVGQLLFGVAAMLSAVLVAVNRLWLVVASWAAALALLFALNVLPFGAAVGPSAVFLLDVEALLFGLAISMAVALYDINTYR
ncbi:hypothetical protein, partial [Deinococcus pimensis]|uniref:hypothetical protein n=1 Tax=Deinococcus pimensis TaxID=309888 RepID=UPI0005EB63BD